MTADDRPAFDEAAETMKNVIAGIRQWADDDVIAATDKLERAIVDFRKMVPEPATARTPGRIAYEAYQESTPYASASWKSDLNDEDYWAAWESAAAAVIAHHEQQQTEDAPAAAVPSWSPVVGGWAEHAEWGRVLVVESHMFRDEYLCAYADVARSVAWADAVSLSAPVPRVWESAYDVPAHVVVTDSNGIAWAGADVDEDLTDGGIPMGPFTEVLPVGGVW